MPAFSAGNRSSHSGSRCCRAPEASASVWASKFHKLFRIPGQSDAKIFRRDPACLHVLGRYSPDIAFDFACRRVGPKHSAAPPGRSFWTALLGAQATTASATARNSLPQWTRHCILTRRKPSRMSNSPASTPAIAAKTGLVLATVRQHFCRVMVADAHLAAIRCPCEVRVTHQPWSDHDRAVSRASVWNRSNVAKRAACSVVSAPSAGTWLFAKDDIAAIASVMPR